MGKHEEEDWRADVPPESTIPDPLLGYRSWRRHYNQASGVGSCQSPGLPASTSGREAEMYSARAPVRTQVGGFRGISPLFSEDVILRLLVPDRGNHLREGPTELETSGKNSWRHWPGAEGSG